MGRPLRSIGSRALRIAGSDRFDRGFRTLRTGKNAGVEPIEVANGIASALLAKRRARRPLARVGDVAGAVGRGLLAGAAGTAAMTASSAIETRARGRPASSAPAQAVESAFGVKAADERSRRRLSTAVHWLYGTGWGGVRGLIGAAGIAGPGAVALHLLLVWGAELVTLPALEVAPPPWKWQAREIAVDVLHHGVYATATSVAYGALDLSG